MRCKEQNRNQPREARREDPIPRVQQAPELQPVRRRFPKGKAPMPRFNSMLDEFIHDPERWEVP
jgi:hypothetical protein